jgi:hypothetical protein
MEKGAAIGTFYIYFFQLFLLLLTDSVGDKDWLLWNVPDATALIVVVTDKASQIQYRS